jgi:GNAT superfamily N-acetyltransferase
VSGIIVRPARRADLESLSAVLARAFFDDPPVGWLLPRAADRERRLRRMFMTTLRTEALHLGGVEVACDGDVIVGGAIWLPPNRWQSSLGRQLLSLPGYCRAFGRRIGYAQVFVAAALRLHPHQAHWYLYGIGVDPGHQGRGAGAALLRSRLSYCDEQQAPAYLESSKPGNVPLYEHFGFEATGDLALPADAPAVTTMWRPASQAP